MSTNSSEAQHLDGWIGSPNFRGTGDILWSCFIAVFVCTWTVLHLNLPPEHEGEWRPKLRKARWMTMAVIVPEIVTCCAFVQRVAAREAVCHMEVLGHKWSLTQAFYLNMGGVWLHPHESKPFPINAIQLQYLIKEGVLPCPVIKEREIWDRSKVDKFAKLFACLQIFWLAMQAIARATQALPVTPLEIAVLGFAIPSLATFAFWYSKPVDIECPSEIKIDLTTEQLLEKLSPKVYSWRDTPLDFIHKVNAPSLTSELIIKNRIPGWRKFDQPADRIRNDIFALKYTKLDQLVVFSTWLGYAGTHFSAWAFSFPTRIELILWRTCCIIMASSMAVLWITSNRKFYLLVPMLMPWLKEDEKEKFVKVAYGQQRVSGVLVVSGLLTTLAYLFARLTIIALAFSSLRSLPRDAFVTVNWTAYWPHMS